ncbi:MAG: hypothetical protein IT376_22120 [Polyangiaceae bacterium]|nr:hypothetical protein [Polyangiaceae bacterium]
MNPTRLDLLAALVAALTASPACGPTDADAGEGTARFQIWGEEYIEQGVPADVFEDGWRVTFSKFILVVGDVTIADAAGALGGGIPGAQVLDLVRPGPHVLGEAIRLPAQPWPRVGYSIPRVPAASALHATASEADRAALDGRHAVHVEATATGPAGEQRRFSWSFDRGTRYRDCVQVLETSERAGIVVANGGSESVELTIHGDHFFYDDLAAETARVRFQPIADADADGDGEVTQAELAAVRLVDLPPGTYGTGAADVDDLGAFIAAQVATLGHFRGEGHCVAEPL